MSEDDSVAMIPDAKWTDNCQGKKDFDGPLLTISCRYWPGLGGGGGDVFDSKTGAWSVAPYGRRPSAAATILLHRRDADPLEVRVCDFEADTESEVRAAVEAWVQTQFDATRALFAPPLKESP